MIPDRSRLAILGLDGLSLDMTRTLCGLTNLPALAGIVDDPRAHAVRSELPELSPVNWTSLATGLGPEEHGVFGFTGIGSDDYAVRVGDADDIRAPRFWESLGARGLTCKVVNWPNAYPARPFPGMLVAGFVAPELSRACHPPVLARILGGKGYRLEADTARGKDDPDLLLRELHAMIASRRLALDLLWPDLAFDCFALVLTETDRLFHFLLHAVLDQTHPLHGACMAWLSAFDALVGEFLERFAALPEPRRLMVVADHGFAPLITEVDVNAWLVRHGFLRLAGRPRHELDAAVIAPGSRALALDPGRVFVHVRDRFARGSVPPAERRAVARDVAEGLMALRFKGEPVMERIFTGEELYPGAIENGFAAQVPDLVCQAKPGFSLTAKWDRGEIFGRFGRSGCHTAQGALWFDTRGSRPERMRNAGREITRHFEGRDGLTSGLVTA